MIRLHPTPIAAPVELPVPRAGAALSGLRDAFVAAPGVEPLLDRLDDPELTVVSTGQQAGLFTGPLYSVHKALSAAALADLLATRWSRPVLPVFWLAGDDHDFAEASVAAWTTDDGELVEVRLPARPPGAPMLPMYREPLGPAVGALLARFVGALPPGPERERTADWLIGHYRPEATIAGAYAGAMAELLAPLGVLCLDSTHPAFKRAAAPHLLRALEQAAPLDRILAAVGERYQAAGDTPPVQVGDGAALVFLEDRLGRDRLVGTDTGFVTRRGGDRHTIGELRRIADEQPERLSASVLLRPVVESAVLPTVAYVAGPGELRYLAMTPDVYRHLEVPRQTPVPRWSGVIIEPHTERLLARFGATVEDLGGIPGGLERRVLREQLPAEVRAALAELDAQTARLHDRLEPGALAIDPTLAGPIQSSRRQMQWAARDLERRMLRRLRVREAVELAQIRRLRGALRPGGKPQERVLTVAPFLARHGYGLLPRIREAAAGWYAAALEGAGRGV